MIFKNLKDNRIAKATNPKIIAEYMEKTKENKNLKIEDIEWEIGTENDLPKEPVIKAPTIEEIKKSSKITAYKEQLIKLSEDIIQDQAGEVVPDIEQKKAEFIRIHSELRKLEDKEPRELKK